MSALATVLRKPESTNVGEVLIRLDGVGKDFPKVETGARRLSTLLKLLLRTGDIDHFRALEGIDLELRRGESLGLVGVNGAGKSTLLKIIAGVAKPSHGQVRVNARISALLELGSGFHPEYTGRENIYLAAALMGLSKAETVKHVEDIIAFADIGPHIDEPIKHYSSGMVVRLGFAVATVLRPEVLITDEVLAVGDESFQKKCMRWMERFLADGGTLLLVSHSMYHVQTLCSRAMWLHDGKVRAQGDSFDVTREYLTWHEEKRREDATGESPAGAPNRPAIEKTWLERPDGEPKSSFLQGEDVVLQGTVRSAESEAPVVAVGVVRADGSPVYGTHSNEGGFVLSSIAPGRYAFAFRMNSLALLPGKYWVRAHALDPQGLRLFDTVEAELVVAGRTRDYGLVALAHEWLPGRGRPRDG